MDYSSIGPRCPHRGRPSSPSTRRGSCRSSGSRRRTPWRNRGVIPDVGGEGVLALGVLRLQEDLAGARGVLFPVRAIPSPAPAPITARITRPIRTCLPVRRAPPLLPTLAAARGAGERVGGTGVPGGDATNPGAVGSPEEAEGLGKAARSEAATRKAPQLPTSARARGPSRLGTPLR